MKAHHRALASLYPLFRCKSKLTDWMSFGKPRLRVLLYHDIAPWEMDHFSAQLQWLAKRWTFLSPVQFEAIITGNMPLRSDSVLLTFDDGFKSNHQVARDVLNPMGIHALFFIVPHFAAINSPRDAREFIVKHIYPNRLLTNIPDHWTNMTWHDIQDLVHQGHTIGSHTLTHARLSEINDPEHLEYEIMQSANLLEDYLGMQVDHFAYTFGDVASFSHDALRIALRRFKFIYSGLRGVNNCALGIQSVIRRDSVSASDSLFLLGSFLEGTADFHYRHSCARIDQWGNNDHRDLL